MNLKKIALLIFIFLISSCSKKDFLVNTAPEIVSLSSFSIDENTTLVSTFLASDQQNDPISFFVEGPDSGSLSIGTVSGILVFIEAPNYENPKDINGDNIYEIDIVASDGSDSSSLKILISINDIDENPLTSISVDKTTVSSYSQIILTWECLRSTSAFADGNWAGSKSLSGSESVYLSTSGTKTFTLTCANDEAETSNSVEVNVQDIVLKNVPISVSLFKDEQS